MLYPVIPALGFPPLSHRPFGSGLAAGPSSQSVARTEQTALWEVLMRPA